MVFCDRLLSLSMMLARSSHAGTCVSRHFWIFINHSLSFQPNNHCSTLRLYSRFPALFEQPPRSAPRLPNSSSLPQPQRLFCFSYQHLLLPSPAYAPTPVSQPSFLQESDLLTLKHFLRGPLFLLLPVHIHSNYSNMENAPCHIPCSIALLSRTRGTT